MPQADNMWYGTSVPTAATEFFFSDKHKCFLSIEPLHGGGWSGQSNFELLNIDWVIIGAESGKRRDKVVPKTEWCEDIVWCSDYYQIPVFMKDSMLPIVGEPNMRRCFPW